MKIGLLITARLKSSRLPFKLLKDLNGYTIIEHVIKRAKKVKGIDEIVLCTSRNPQDKPLTDTCVEQSIHYYLGSEVDVLDRMYNAGDFFGLDAIISITGENPLFSIDYANRVVDTLLRDKSDFVVVEGLPIGCAVYGLNMKALKLVCKIKTEIDTEIWGILFNRPEIFKISKLVAEEYLNRPTLRLTNDYPEDFQMMSAIFNYFPHQSTPNLISVFELLDRQPDILHINKNRKQSNVSAEVLKRVSKFYLENKKDILQLKDELYKC